MNGWILILMMHVGPFGHTDSNSLTTAQFGSQQACVAAGKAAVAMAEGTVKQIKFVCAQQ